MLNLLIAILLSVPVVAVAAEPAALSLEETFDAYAHAIIQGDERAREKLRCSLGTAGPGQFEDIADMVDDLLYEPLDDLSNQFTGSARDAVRARLSTVSCRVTGTETSKLDSDGNTIAVVHYLCSYPDPTSIFKAFREPGGKVPAEIDTLDQLETVKAMYAAGLPTVPDRTYEAAAEFFRAGDNGPWASFDVLAIGLRLESQLNVHEAWRKQKP